MHSRYCSHASRARIPCKKYHAGTMRAPPRAHDQSDRFLELLRAWTSSSTLSPSSRSRASSTDGHYHRRRRSHHRLRYRRALVIFNIAVVGAIFIIVADVADVILSSRTSEYRRHAHLHHRRTQTIIGIHDTIIDAVSGRTVATRIMSFARQVAGGRVGCLREQWK